MEHAPFQRFSTDQLTTSIESHGAESTVDPCSETRFPEFAVEERLGRFVLRHRLGAGAFGTVYLAYDPQLQREVALKVARTGKLATETDIEWFFREARAAAQFKHPHIVPVFEVGREGSHAYIVTALIEGETLAAQLQGRRYSAEEAAGLALQLAEAVHYAHQKGVFHRDIKPANVMIDADGAAHLMDFGLARRMEGEELRTRAGEIIGTPAYMSPEQACGDGYAVDARSDVYSLGVVLYELLTGKRPFSGSVYEVIRQVQEAEPLSPRRLDKRIPPDLEAICAKAMAKIADDRYPSVLHFAEDLRRWQINQPVQARRTNVWTRAGKWMRRHPVGSFAIAASLAAMTAAVTYFQTRPAWLDLRIAPIVPGARARLNGGPLVFDSQGRALVQLPPGKMRVAVDAEGFLTVEREVVLVRGRENELLVAIELVPTFGYAQVTSDPEGATVDLLDEQGQSVARGTTPFNSPRLPSGKYTAKISKELYKPAEQVLEAPLGERVASAPLVKLEPLLEHASSFEFLRSVRRRLSQETSFEALELPLRDAVSKLADQEGITILLEERALEDAGVSATIPCTLTRRELPLASVLEDLTARLRLTYRAEPTAGNNWLIRVTTPREDAEHQFTVVYAVKDLVAVPGGPVIADFDTLIRGLTTTVSPTRWDQVGGPGSIAVDPGTLSLLINQNWRTHLEIDDFLVNLREAHLNRPQPKPYDGSEAESPRGERSPIDDQTGRVPGAAEPNSGPLWAPSIF